MNVKSSETTRRGFLKDIGKAAVVLAAGPAAMRAAEKTPRKPNVIVILTDDQGSVDMNCYGAKDLITPNMDALAKRGVRFGQFYAGAPVCSPSRASLLTGRYPQRAQLASNAGRRGMPASQLTMAEVFKSAGYRTALFGKWHLGEDLAMSPNAQGFDEFLGHKVGCIDNYSHFFYWSGPNRHDLWKDTKEHFEDGTYFPDIMVREAARFITDNAKRPFFLFLPFNTPHYPLQGEQKFVKMYAKMKDIKRKRYASFVTSLDDKIGQVIATVDKLKLRDDTIIIFQSDHGHSVEVRTFGGGGSAGPYRGHKFTCWEGGLRVPAIISWPGRIPQGKVRNQVACSIDWLATVAEYCKLPAIKTRIDGKSLSGVIESSAAPSPHKTLHWSACGMWAVREGKWKLVGGKSAGLFLSDMDADVTETKNLAKEHPDVVTRLKRLHQEWSKEVVTQ
ncbi:MAG: sulfatase-like hydrolase/transferase [Phycisphaerae bacterium]|jgi:arylsulfatase A-like enzyme|nr:sulfatase-like hydrolase/transferase [Phycisphaerae bacterium]